MSTTMTETTKATNGHSKQSLTDLVQNGAKAQPGQKKRSARQRIQEEMAAANQKASAKKSSKKPAGKPVAKAAVKESNGRGHGIVEANAKAAAKNGCFIYTWKKGIRTGNPVETFQVWVTGTRVRALTGNFDSMASAKAAIKAAGLKVTEQA